MKISKTQKRRLERKYLEIFVQEARNIWNDSEVLKTTEFECVISTRMTRALAKLTQFSLGRRIAARGNTLISIAPKIRLTISAKTLELTEDDIMKVIRHEAIHIGHMNHGRVFKQLCLRFNASYKGYNMDYKPPTGFTVQTQVRKGQRYQTVAKYESQDEADAKAKELFATMKYQSVRIQYYKQR